MKMRIGLRFIIGLTVLVLVSLSAHAAELAILRNGFTIRHDHHEIRGTVVRLYLGDSAESYVDFPSEEISGYEPIGDPIVSDSQNRSRSVEKASAQVLADGMSSVDTFVTAASVSHKIDPDFVWSIIHVESAFHEKAVSRKGALGLMQIMPQTAKKLGLQDPFDPKANVEAGTRYIDELLRAYDNDAIMALAAYNAGPERVEKYHGMPPFPETQRYVVRVMSDFRKRKQRENSELQRKSDRSKAAPEAMGERGAPPTQAAKLGR